MKKQTQILIGVVVFILIIFLLEAETKMRYPFLTSLAASCVGGLIVAEYATMTCKE
tara:strand:- start:113 stop:280 length:168 start_codon:yes stop_codon:yes gene_type:complete